MKEGEKVPLIAEANSSFPSAPPIQQQQLQEQQQPPTYHSNAALNAPPSYIASQTAPSAPPLSPDDLVRVGNGANVTMVHRRDINYEAVACFNNDAEMSTAPTDVHAFSQPFITEDVGCQSGLKRSPHLKSLILTLGLWTMIVIRIIVAAAPDVIGYSSDTVTMFEKDEFFYPVFFGIYLIYLIEACCSSTSGYVHNKLQDPNPHVAAVLDTPPTIRFHIQCYHYETRTRTVRDSNGNTRTETYTERVNTHSASENFHILQWFDDSMPFFVPNYEICQMKFFKNFKFTTEALSRFECDKARFIRENDRDVHYSYSESRFIGGMKSHALTFHENATLPCSSNPTWFWIFTLLSLSWFVRTHLGSQTGEFKYTYSKVIAN
eukprot:m.41991 g.41991  ORF g.41991 m.41991 type:complete len:378 (-) comp10479_c0_seq1:687-1820(-)